MNRITPDSGPPLADGTWKIEGSAFIKTYPGKPDGVYTLLSITHEKLTIQDAEGKTYTQDRW